MGQQQRRRWPVAGTREMGQQQRCRRQMREERKTAQRACGCCGRKGGKEERTRAVAEVRRWLRATGAALAGGRNRGDGAAAEAALAGGKNRGGRGAAAGAGEEE
ncbi:hypothetical protein BHE74_00021117, partial [Ensete ventricosum]